METLMGPMWTLCGYMELAKSGHESMSTIDTETIVEFRFVGETRVLIED